MKKARLRLMSLAALICVAGCSTGYEIYDPPPRELAVPVMIMHTKFAEVKVLNATPAEFKILRRDFENADKETQLSVISVELDDHPDEIHFDHHEAAHCHMGRRDFSEKLPKWFAWMPRIVRRKCDICIDSYRLYPGLLRHEMTHAQVEADDISLDKFAEICAGGYIGAAWRLLYKQSEFPRDGFLHPYDTKDEYEHSANLVEVIHCFMLGLPDQETGGAPFRGVNFKDGRYLAQIKEVYRLGLVSKAEYDAVSAYFEKHKK